MPFFSIVIPVFNRAGLFRQTLASVLSQGFTDFEIVIVDDGSTDNTSNVVREIMQQEPRVRYVFQENSERGRARNNGIQQSMGRYIVLFDSDDFMHANHLQVLHEHILRLGEPAFIATKFDFTRDGRHRNGDIAGLAEGYYDYRLFLRGNPMACNICLRKDNVVMHGFEEDRRYAMLEDWMFFLQNLRHEKLYLINQVTISMNDHDNRSMLNNSALVQKAALALDWMLKHVELSPGEQRMLAAQVNYFSAIHSYLDGLRGDTNRFLGKAMSLAGFRTVYAVLWLKNLVGRRRIQQLFQR